ncbi:FCD domain-containing protein [Streptomyces gardneri]|uniref:GntR C-terminal domain-containing protein n=1 Tax=Streptomyces gardneri TaxID=66892 RepID=A0A4Y3RU32_9ACTN|nr:FCD domain-containing protein [Streptomyces gardneri]GEB60253.1 hypothetical protein SGA01_58580 [Streptomyces gardneri]GHH21601.1 hypothetical protein GCM10017674_76440 [Streptomyces gardneri]
MPVIVLLGVYVTYALNQSAARRERRAKTLSEALTAVEEYLEMPYRSRRRTRACRQGFTHAESGAIDRLSELNTSCHRALAEATGYRILADLTEQLLLTIRRYRAVAPIDEMNWRSVIEHDGIIGALRRGDATAAADAARAHTVAQARHEVGGDA